MKTLKSIVTFPFRALTKSLKKLRQKIAYFFEVKYQKDTTYILIILIIFIFGTSFLMWRDCLAYESKSKTSFKVNTERIERRINKYSARVINHSKEVRTTPEQQYTKAYREDTGFRGYIEAMQVKRNNPGNLVFANQPNATKDGRFASFKTPYDGFRALIMQITMDMNRGDDLQTFIYEYAPSSENDTIAYLNFLEEACGSRYLSLKDIDIVHLAVKITEFEHGIRFN